MIPDSPAIDQAITMLLPKAESLLCRLIAVPSLSGQEEAAIEMMRAEFTQLQCSVLRQAIDPAIKSDPDYSFLEANLDYAGRGNLIVRRNTDATGRSAILQTHLDVVPDGGWVGAFSPARTDGAVIGRGACDCKGQAAVLWLVFATLDALDVRLDGPLTAQLVVEEEIGGNGALAAILGGDRADAAIILEPTKLMIHPACRGACWFRYSITGLAVHMGRRHEGISAFEKAMLLCDKLREYEDRLIAASLNVPLFESYDRPVQVNIGVVRAGEWPSMVPAACVIEGGVGFLPNKPMREVQEELAGLIVETGDEWLARNTVLDFPKLHNDAYRSDPEHPAVRLLAAACKEHGVQSEVKGWNVSCDARLYALRGGMEAIVFGPGDIADAHSDHEQILMSDVASAAKVLVRWIIDWCGIAGRANG